MHSLHGFQLVESADQVCIELQVTKQWKVAHANMKKLHGEAVRLLTSFLSHEVHHIYRCAVMLLHPATRWLVLGLYQHKMAQQCS